MMSRAKTPRIVSRRAGHPASSRPSCSLLSRRAWSNSASRRCTGDFWAATTSSSRARLASSQRGLRGRVRRVLQNCHRNAAATSRDWGGSEGRSARTAARSGLDTSQRSRTRQCWAHEVGSRDLSTLARISLASPRGPYHATTDAASRAASTSPSGCWLSSATPNDLRASSHRPAWACACASASRTETAS